MESLLKKKDKKKKKKKKKKSKINGTLDVSKLKK